MGGVMQLLQRREEKEKGEEKGKEKDNIFELFQFPVWKASHKRGSILHNFLGGMRINLNS